MSVSHYINSQFLKVTNGNDQHEFLQFATDQVEARIIGRIPSNTEVSFCIDIEFNRKVNNNTKKPFIQVTLFYRSS